MIRRLAAVAACAAALAACAARLPARPGGPERPDPTAIDAFTEATRSCAGVKTLTVEIRLSGRAGSERMRGTLHAGLAAPASIRVEALAPFGQPLFVLAGREDRATLLLPRDNLVLPDAPVAAVLERLTGLALTAEDLRLVLTGCLSAAAAPSNGRAYNDDWRAVTLDSGVVAYVRQVNGAPAVVAADHGDWHVDYASHQGGWPREVRIRSRAGDVDLTAVLGELQMNIPIDARAFEAPASPTATAITLDQLRKVTPLRAPQ